MALASALAVQGNDWFGLAAASRDLPYGNVGDLAQLAPLTFLGLAATQLWSINLGMLGLPLLLALIIVRHRQALSRGRLVVFTVLLLSVLASAAVSAFFLHARVERPSEIFEDRYNGPFVFVFVLWAGTYVVTRWRRCARELRLPALLTMLVTITALGGIGTFLQALAAAGQIKHVHSPASALAFSSFGVHLAPAEAPLAIQALIFAAVGVAWLTALYGLVATWPRRTPRLNAAGLLVLIGSFAAVQTPYLVGYTGSAEETYRGDRAVVRMVASFERDPAGQSAIFNPWRDFVLTTRYPIYFRRALVVGAELPPASGPFLRLARREHLDTISADAEACWALRTRYAICSNVPGLADGDRDLVPLPVER